MQLFRFNISAVATAVATAAGLCAPVSAQWGTKAAKPNAAVSLRAPVTLPDMPHYAGDAIYRDGIMQDSPLGTGYIYHYLVRENNKQVLTWYQQAMSSAGWQIKNPTECGFAASKSTARVLVRCYGFELKPGYKSELTISYRIQKQQ